MTNATEILLMNVQHFEHLLKQTQEESKRQQIAKLLAETRAELLQAERNPSPRR